MAKSKLKTPDKAELSSYIENPPLIRAVFWCSFEAKGTLEEFQKNLSVLKDIKWFTAEDFIDGKEQAVLWGWTAGKRSALQFSQQGKLWQLELTFREMGTSWGSNQAEWNRHKSVVFPLIKATKIKEETE